MISDETRHDETQFLWYPHGTPVVPQKKTNNKMVLVRATERTRQAGDAGRRCGPHPCGTPVAYQTLPDDTTLPDATKRYQDKTRRDDTTRNNATRHDTGCRRCDCQCLYGLWPAGLRQPPEALKKGIARLHRPFRGRQRRSNEIFSAVSLRLRRSLQFQGVVPKALPRALP